MEAGVWRGGGVIFMRAFLAAYGDEKRKVWAVRLASKVCRSPAGDLLQTTTISFGNRNTWPSVLIRSDPISKSMGCSMTGPFF